MDFFWEKRGWEANDRHFAQLEAMPFKRNFPNMPIKKGLYVVRGPRQIGKSSWLKQILQKYAKSEKCFYLSCEQIENYKELSSILYSVKDRKIVLLDEISFIDKWDRAVKHAIDSGYTNILVITGSHAYDLKRGSDRMPGRFDSGGEFLILPMLFDEFYKMRVQAGWQQDNRIDELKAYFRVGGFPLAVAESGEKAKLSQKTINTYWSWLAGDVAKLGKREAYLKELLIQIALSITTPVSLHSLGSKTNIGSHNTISEYLELLEACFAIRTLSAIDLNTGASRPKKNRKIYFSDPLIYWMALSFLDSPRVLDQGHESSLAEMIAHEYLARNYSRFGYFSNENGEVDFIKANNWALEIKWSAIASNLSKAYYGIKTPWKGIWTYENFLKEFPPES